MHTVNENLIMKVGAGGITSRSYIADDLTLPDAFACFVKVSTELLSLCDPTEDGYVEFSEIVRALRLKAIGGKDQAEYMKKMSKLSLQVTSRTHSHAYALLPCSLLPTPR